MIRKAYRLISMKVIRARLFHVRMNILQTYGSKDYGITTIRILSYGE